MQDSDFNMPFFVSFSDTSLLYEEKLSVCVRTDEKTFVCAVEEPGLTPAKSPRPSFQKKKKSRCLKILTALRLKNIILFDAKSHN